MGTARKRYFHHGLLFTTALVVVSPAQLSIPPNLARFKHFILLRGLTVYFLVLSISALTSTTVYGHCQKEILPPRSIVHNCIGGGESFSITSAALNSNFSYVLSSPFLPSFIFQLVNQRVTFETCKNEDSTDE